MLFLKKIQLCVVVLSSLFLSLVKQTGMTEMPSLASNSRILDNISDTSHDHDGWVFIIYITPQIQNVQSQNCISITCRSDSTEYFV